MTKSVNKVTLIGRLGRDPELKYTASGTAYCRFSIATDDSWNDLFIDDRVGQDSYGILNAGIGTRVGGGSMELFVDNLTD